MVREGLMVEGQRRRCCLRVFLTLHPPPSTINGPSTLNDLATLPTDALRFLSQSGGVHAPI